MAAGGNKVVIVHARMRDSLRTECFLLCLGRAWACPFRASARTRTRGASTPSTPIPPRARISAILTRCVDRCAGRGSSAQSGMAAWLPTPMWRWSAQGVDAAVTGPDRCRYREPLIEHPRLIFLVCRWAAPIDRPSTRPMPHGTAPRYLPRSYMGRHAAPLRRMRHVAVLRTLPGDPWVGDPSRGRRAWP